MRDSRDGIFAILFSLRDPEAYIGHKTLTARFFPELFAWLDAHKPLRNLRDLAIIRH